MHKQFVFLLAALGLAAKAAAVSSASFSPQPWLDDFAAIKQGMAQYYANLDSQLMKKRVDPSRLDSQVKARLGAARSDLEAYDTLRDFVQFFDDPHLKLKFMPPSGVESGRVTQDEKPRLASCEAAGYKDRKKDFAPPMAALPGWRQIGDGAFPRGIAGRIGVVRIASFGEDSYLDQCREVFRPGLNARDLQLATRAALQGALAAAIAELKAAGAETLLIDISGNGGGSEWDREAASLFTSAVLRRAEPRIADAPCDRSAIWAGKPPCEVFRPGSDVVEVQGKGNWTGRLAILADARTGSAAEEFIGWLVDNRAATLIGERTAGAGCGYVDGGRPVALKAAPITLVMPNCARFTAAGQNEIEGWKPAVALAPPAKGDEAAWAKALAGALGG
jgi:hypothetical protein